MATPTPISHPQQGAQQGQFYPFSVTIKSLSGNVLVGPFACAYEATTGGAPGMFEDEAPVGDKILIPSWQPDIAAKSQAVLDVAGTKRRFEISDVLPQGAPPSQTLLIVTPT